MKRALVLPVVVIAALLLASCYMMSTEPTGSISINLGGPTVRTITSSSLVRVYLYTFASSTSYSLYTFPDSKPYQEFQYGTGTKTFKDIPAGLWDVLVSVGSDGPNGSFYTTDYGHSGVINVVGGTDTAASVTTGPSPLTISTDLLGQNLTGVALGNYATGAPAVLASSSSMLWIGNLGADLSVGTPTSPVMAQIGNAGQIASNGLQIRSMNQGYAETGNGAFAAIFTNTNKGIVPYDPTGGFDLTYSISLADATGARYSVKKSVAMAPYIAGYDYVGVFYSRGSAIGGVYLDPLSNVIPYDGSRGARWVDVPLSSDSTEDSVYDIAVNDNGSSSYAYFATKYGAFRIDTGLIKEGQPTAGDLSRATFFAGPNNAKIQALSVDGYAGQIYIGTPMGAYSAPIDESNPTKPVGSWTLYKPTEGDNITMVSTNVSGSGSIAFASRYNLYTSDSYTGDLRFAFYSGLPGEIRSLAWDTNDGYLYVAGSAGLTSVPVSMPPQ